MIVIKSNADQVAMKFANAERMIMKTAVKSINGVTLAGERFAKRIAPVKDGELKKGIYRKPIIRKGKEVSKSLVSTVPGDFAYNKWVNVSPGFETVKGRTYRSTRHTGVPGYFTLTAKYMSKIYAPMAMKELKKGLKIVMK